MDGPVMPPVPPLPALNTETPTSQPLVPSNGEGSNPNPPPGEERDEDSDRSEDEGDDDDRLNRADDEYPWIPIYEDTAEAGEDEIRLIERNGEHSAKDYSYWERKTFFELNDKELVPGESGRIDFLVERLNGTRENPNKEYVMRSKIVRIGGYDWQIKFFPRGNDTDYLSVYVDCVSMLSPDFEGVEDFSRPPLPFHPSHEKVKRRKAVSAQVCIVMYNPNEPRSYYYKRDAHQFSKQSPDCGYQQFGHHNRYHFGERQAGKQRQSILRNDQLAFSAYLRIINDPTGCLWDNRNNSRFEDSVALTGLRPFSPQTVMLAAQLPLLHFAPFRQLLYRHKDSRIVFWMQTLLWKMMSRKRTSSYGEPDDSEQSDPASCLRLLSRYLRSETDSRTVAELLGTLDPKKGAAIASNRLKTKSHPNVQEAINNHSTKLETPVLLPLELERQEFNQKDRKWTKITKEVAIQNHITVNQTQYTLFALATHCDELESNHYNTYVRPNGPSTPWYRYSEGRVQGMTHKDAVEKHSGYDEEVFSSKIRRYSHHRSQLSIIASLRNEDPKEVAQTLIYVRDDHTKDLGKAPVTEDWDVPQHVREGIPPGSESSDEEKTLGEASDKDMAEAPEAPAENTEDVPPVSAPEGADTSHSPLVDPPSDDSHSDSDLDADAGYATPECWPMDGEDIVMSEPEHDSEMEDSDDEAEEVTIDVLGREYYHGQMKNSVYHGQGTLIGMNGDQYTGSFVYGRKSGSGKIIYALNGNVYEGEWLDNEPHGRGKLTEAATGNVFEGGWKHGKKHGEFVLKGTVTDEDKGCCSICYERDINTAFYDCGHVVACKGCAAMIENCPVCRRRVVARLELFGVKLMVE